MSDRGKVKALAAALGVNRRRIPKWREEGAPASFDPAEWSVWLKDTGRTKILARLNADASTAPLVGLAPADFRRAAPEGAAAAAGDDDADIDAVDLTTAPEVPRPLPDAGPAAWEKYYKARGNRQSALNAERQARKDARDLIPASDVKALLIATAASLLESLGDTVWLSQRPHLDGVADTLRKTLRTAHDQALLTVRARIPPLLRDKFTAIANPPAKPA